MTQNTQPNQMQTQEKNKEKRPNDVGSVNVEGFVKIFDPKTQEIFVEKRA